MHFNSFDITYNKQTLNDNVLIKLLQWLYVGYDLDKTELVNIPYRPVKNYFLYIVNRYPWDYSCYCASLFMDIIDFQKKYLLFLTWNLYSIRTQLMKK